VVVAASLAELAGFEHLFDRGEKAASVGLHDAEEFLLLFGVYLTALEGVEIETDAGDGCFELVRDGIEERVLALVAADFPDEEYGVEDDAGDENEREDETKKIDGQTAAVEVNPRKVEEEREHSEAHAQRDEKRYRSPAPVVIHGSGRSIAATACCCGKRKDRLGGGGLFVQEWWNYMPAGLGLFGSNFAI